jgi:hypothetical protein
MYAFAMTQPVATGPDGNVYAFGPVSPTAAHVVFIVVTLAIGLIVLPVPLVWCARRSKAWTLWAGASIVIVVAHLAVVLLSILLFTQGVARGYESTYAHFKPLTPMVMLWVAALVADFAVSETETKRKSPDGP